MANHSSPGTDDPFFVGYEPTMAAPIARTVRWGVLVAVVLSALLALLMVVGQRRFAHSVFEFGTVRDFEGVIRLVPSPSLEVARPYAVGQPSRYHLVAQGKFGALGEVAPFDGQRVDVRGTLIYRAGVTMIEVVPGGVSRGAAGPAVPKAAGSSTYEQVLGPMTLVGEIVDSKCHLGVMKPGAGKPHRACAVRCISGGVPPMLLLRDADGPARWMLLVGPDGGSVSEQVLPFVAEPIEISGTVTKQGDVLVLAADPATFRRLL